jgi:hypothetical protein
VSDPHDSLRRQPISLSLAVLLAVPLAALLATPTPEEAGTEFLSPQRVLGVVQEGKLLLTINPASAKRLPAQGILTAQLLDDRGKVLAQDRQQLRADSPPALRLDAPSLAAEKVRLRLRHGDDVLLVPLRRVLLLKGHETAVSTGQELFPGSKAAFRCEVHGVRSIGQTVPLGGAAIRVHLSNREGKTWPMYEAKTGTDGAAVGVLTIPDVPAGRYEMEVTTASPLGDERLTRTVTLHSAARVWLVTDKPLYQPGQRMHLRALALDSFNLRPAAGQNVTLEVEDSRGNKVFKRSVETSAYGIAAADFDLADEVNVGDYHVRAILAEHTADRVVPVKPYVLPKFKAELTTDRKFGLPGDTVRVELQADYFFGKPVANARVEATAGFDGQPRPVETWRGTTDERGHASFEIHLPEDHLPAPLAPVRLAAAVTDAGGSRQQAGLLLPLAQDPIEVRLIPEGGRLVPELENRVFVAAVHPDGSPAQCDVKIWLDTQPLGLPLAEVKTDAFGLAEFRLTPTAGQLTQGQQGRIVEMANGKLQKDIWPQPILRLVGEAKADRGESVLWREEILCEPLGENIRLRLDRVVYAASDRVEVQVHSTAGLASASIDIVKAGQLMQRTILQIDDGKGAATVELPADLYGTLEFHACQLLATGEVLRDSRVVYVQPRQELKVAVKADKDTFHPGEQGMIRFQVTDAAGKPAQAALGVMVVDEAVYALHDMRPKLATVYFTLQQELLQPHDDDAPRPAGSLDQLAAEKQLPPTRQRVAEALLAAVRPPRPPGWRVDPALERVRAAQQQAERIAAALFLHADGGRPFLAPDKAPGRSRFRSSLLEELVKEHFLDEQDLTLPTAERLTLEALARMEKHFTADRLAHALTCRRLIDLTGALARCAARHRQEWFAHGSWSFPDGMLAAAVKDRELDALDVRDGWDREIHLTRLKKKRLHFTGLNVFDRHELVSAGPDGVFGTPDDVSISSPVALITYELWYKSDATLEAIQTMLRDPLRRGQWAVGEGAVEAALNGMPDARLGLAASGGLAGLGGLGGLGGIGGLGGFPMPAAPAAAPVKQAPAPPRLRDYFPETLLWQPALVTDKHGKAELPVRFADSITTWRLSASASSKAGLLGSTGAPLRVFQDFFVDVDLPPALTRNDEIAFPVAVHNYLPGPQRVTIALRPDDWFELADGKGASRTLELRPKQIASVSFRIRARKVGRFPLTILAQGSKVSDAVKRSVEVRPDGMPVEQIAGGHLMNSATHAIVVPDNAIPGSTRLLVRISPSVLSQALQAAEGLLQMPHGCFEQTSASVYPDLLVLDYLQQSRTDSPEVRRRAEEYLQLGYQRLLTFECRGGGFDWWGQGPPVLWLTALGLHEFIDLDRVYPVDSALLQRTRTWLLRQQADDGSWTDGGEERKLLLTSYIAWALAEGDLRGPQVEKAIAYVRAHAGNGETAYVQALAANALAAWDRKDKVLHEVLERLERHKEDRDGGKMCRFPSAGRSLSYATEDSLAVETTALAALAMHRSNLYPHTANRALAYLAGARDRWGAWGSTQATVLALKALAEAAGRARPQSTTHVSVLVNGKEVHKAEVTEDNADVSHQFDLTAHLRPGRNEVTLRTNGEQRLAYQVVGRHFEPHKARPAAPAALELAVNYDRTRLTTRDHLLCQATLKYHGKEPTGMVMVELGVPPGFDVDRDEFSALVAAGKVKKFEAAPDRVALYLGEVAAGSTQTFACTLRPKYPLRVTAPPAVAYEYYTPASRSTTDAVELTVEEAGR